MNELITVSPSPLPLPAANITTRLATMDDLPAIDQLQKLHHKQLGFFPRAQMEGYIRSGCVIVAEAKATTDFADEDQDAMAFSQSAGSAKATVPLLLGYCASRDRYLKRDELGAIFQLCVVPGEQRKFVGANLLKSVFERSAYGTRLYCCWCAQDLAANRFWEAMGFVPLAYRAGSEKRGRKGGARVHIFWQKRIRAGDAATPWWFPSKTEGGAIREDRIVLPIPPGTHWSEARPLVLPGDQVSPRNDEAKPLPAPRRRKTSTATVAPKRTTLAGAFSFAADPPPRATKVLVRKREPAAATKAKSDPRLIAAARELRDRWLEQINQTPLVACGKYSVARQVAEQASLPRLAA